MLLTLISPTVCNMCYIARAEIIKKHEVSQHSRYMCTFCGKFSVQRQAVGIWKCKTCGKVSAGGAYVYT